MVKTVSNLIEASESKVPPTDHLNNKNTSSHILQSVETQASLSLQQNGDVRAVYSNLAVQGTAYSTPPAEDTITGIGFAIQTNSSTHFTNKTSEIFYDENVIHVNQLPHSIFLSSNTVENLKSKMYKKESWKKLGS